MSLEFRHADWPFSDRVLALTSLRRGGVSHGPWHSLNLGMNSGDDASQVSVNRLQLSQALLLPQEIQWLNQTHSCNSIRYGETLQQQGTDAIWTDTPGQPCCILTADCLPVLLCNDSATVVAAVHCGWRGLASGIVSKTISSLPSPAHDLHAWLGPAISAAVYEVGSDVVEAFGRLSNDCATAFRQVDEQHWMADLYHLARILLNLAGVHSVHGGGECTHQQPDDYYSYRRDGATGRMASLIMIKERAD